MFVCVSYFHIGNEVFFPTDTNGKTGKEKSSPFFWFVVFSVTIFRELGYLTACVIIPRPRPAEASKREGQRQAFNSNSLLFDSEGVVFRMLVSTLIP